MPILEKLKFSKVQGWVSLESWLFYMTIYYQRHILPYITYILDLCMFHFAPSKGHTIHYLSPTLRLWDLDAGEVMKELMDLWYPLVSSHPDPPKIFQNHKLCEVDSSIVCESWGWWISGPEYFEILFEILQGMHFEHWRYITKTKVYPAS